MRCAMVVNGAGGAGGGAGGRSASTHRSGLVRLSGWSAAHDASPAKWCRWASRCTNPRSYCHFAEVVVGLVDLYHQSGGMAASGFGRVVGLFALFCRRVQTLLCGSACVARARAPAPSVLPSQLGHRARERACVCVCPESRPEGACTWHRHPAADQCGVSLSCVRRRCLCTRLAIFFIGATDRRARLLSASGACCCPCGCPSPRRVPPWPTPCLFCCVGRCCAAGCFYRTRRRWTRR